MYKLFGIAALLVIACMMLVAPGIADDTFNWGLTSGSGFVDDTANWLEGVVPGDDVNVDDYVYLNNPGTLLIDESHLFAGQVNCFYIGSATGTGNVEQSGGLVDLRYKLVVGYDGAAGTSTYTMTGGTIDQLGQTFCTVGGGGNAATNCVGELYVSGGTSDEDTTLIDFANKNQFRVGYGTNGSGLVSLDDFAYFKMGRFIRLGYGTDVTGNLTMAGDSYAKIAKIESNGSYIGRGEGATGTLTMSENAEALFNTGGRLFVGHSGGSDADGERAVGTINLSGNAIFVANNVDLCRGNYTRGTINITGSASYTSHDTFVGMEGDANVAVMTVSTGAETGATGGTAQINGQLCIGRTLSTGTVTLSETGSIDVVEYVRLGDNGGIATFNLDGGTLSCSHILSEAGDEEKGTTIGTFNFNGGVLQANGENADMIGLDDTYTSLTVNVKSGGAVIDSNGFDIGILQPLIEDATSTGGGLTKTGDGTLTLGGANTYTGDTAVEAGTLSITGNTMLSNTADLLLATGAVMDLDFTGLSETVSGLYLNGIAQAVGTWGATGSGAAHIDDTYFTGTGTIMVGSTQIPGDTNGDLIVDETDATTVASNWGSPTTEGPTAGDFNNDGVVNATDASIMAANWGDHTGGENNAVPEPGALVLFIGLGLALLTRRTQR